MKKESERRSVHECGRLAAAFRAGFIARFLLFFGGLEDRLARSFFGKKLNKVFGGAAFREKISRPFKLTISREIENSAVFNAVNRLFAFLLCLPLRMYGAFLFVYAGGNAVIGTVKHYLESGEIFSLGAVIPFACCALLSFILLLSGKGKSLAGAVLDSRILSALLFDLLGLNNDFFENRRCVDGNYLIVLLLAVCASLPSIFISPYIVPVVLLWILFVRLSFCSPESALIFLILAFPVIPQTPMFACVLIVLISYTVKLLRSKRNFRAGFFGLIMLFFSILALFGTLMTAQKGEIGFGTYFSALACFFLSRMLLDRREWIRRASAAFALAAVLCAVWTVAQFGISFIPAKYKVILSSLTLYKTPFGMRSFESMGIVVSAGLPVLITRRKKEKKTTRKLLTVLGVILLIAAAVVSRSPAAWIALIAAPVLLFVRNRPASVIPLSILIAGGAVVYVFVIPTFITSYIDGFSTGLSVSLQSVLTSLRESAAHFFIGVGEGGVLSGGNIYTHILTANGAAGLLFLLFVVVGTFAYAYMAVHKNDMVSPQLRQLSFGFSAAAGALLTAGIFCDLWNDPKCMYVLFGLLGMIFACGRALLREWKAEREYSLQDIDFLVVTVAHRKTKRKKRREEPEKAEEKDDEKRSAADPDGADGEKAGEDAEKLPTEDAAGGEGAGK